MADSLLKEVDDDLRAERMQRFWQQNKGVLLAFVVALVLGTAANSAWQHHREHKGGRMLGELSANQKLLEQGKADESANGFKAIADGASGEFRDLALVWESRALTKADKRDEAAAALKLAAEKGGNLWSDIACLRLAGIDAKAATPCLSSSAKSPLASTRAEWSAANLWASGDKDGGIAAIEKQLADKDLTQDSRERLMQWLAVMKVDKGSKVEPKDATQEGVQER